MDDDPFNLIALEGLIAQLNCGPVEKAYNGQDGLNKLSRDYQQCSNNCMLYLSETECKNHAPFKAVIVDNQMPLMSGFEMTRVARQMQGNGQLHPRTRFILLSGDDFSGDEEAKQLFDDLLIKPVSKERLERVLRDN